MKWTKHYQTARTPQNQPIPGTSQKANNAGGYAWEVGDWIQLDRFLILGSEGGTYHVSEQKLTIENAEAVRRCIEQDGIRTVKRIAEISESGRAPRNDPALFALAMCAGFGDQQTRKAALEALPRVARIGTHLFHFMDYVQGFRGWGRGLRRAIADWYNQKDVKALAYQAVKYRQRDGWTHRDALRLSHPKAQSDAQQKLYRWITQDEFAPAEGLEIVDAFRQAQTASLKEVVGLIEKYRLPREAIPTEFLTRPEVWEAMLPHMPLEAMVRNLANMTRIGLVTPMSEASRLVVRKLGSSEAIQKARLHPIKVLAALKTYQAGHGMRGQERSWTPVQPVVDALDAAFYTAFGAVTPTDKRIMLALDVSGSMECGQIAGVPGLTPRVASAAMALVTAAVESQHMVTGFSAANGGYGGQWGGGDPGMTPIKISPRQRLDDVIRTVAAVPMGGTDCSLPMRYALKENIPIDTFVVYTDSETWAGRIHPTQALQQYRREMGIAAKLIVVGMVSNRFSIADPKDAGMLDVVGFDTAAPEVMSDFMLQ
ncbi:TROVE domain-containing protein [Deinococcus roseus]|uniref:60 kDa SS-A/Ro ribonucleoprotein n=1 Tax=Deinococcus roseus TaxID=392414 RepID=A0ABQ2D1C7_9DEIO|nr:TROVE domain-containing protein [Deinococcus roseus]GGJ33967.1 60 kDa SS-A/Ro ribonucleoprotein [Deinococcus roseus]